MDYLTRDRSRSDSGFSSSSYDTQSSADINMGRVNFLNNFLIQENINHLTQVIEKIEATKEQFLENYLEKSKQVKWEVKKIYFAAEARKAELETKLQQIARRKLSAWDRQLKICEEAEDWLRNVRCDSSPCVQNLRETCFMYGRDVGLIDSGEIRFEVDEEALNHSLTARMANTIKIMPKICFGIEGKNAMEINRPWGVCTDITGRILVANSNRIQIFNEFGNFLLQFGRTGNKAGEFNKPVGITVDKKCRIIVTDKDNHRVQVFTYSGGFIFMFGKRGHKPGQFYYPWGVDTNLEGDIVIGDTNNHRVQLFTKNGIFVSEFVFNRQILRLNQPVLPIGVTFKPDGTLLVTDLNNHIIFKINEEFSTAVKIEDYKKLYRPQGITCNSKGLFMVADSGHDKIQIFDAQERPYLMFGMSGKHLGEFDNPQGVCFHPNGGIVVGDFGNSRIQVFNFALY